MTTPKKTPPKKPATAKKPTARPTAKPEPKPAPKTTAKKSPAKKAATAKLDLDALTVSQAELAQILGLTCANLTPMIQRGFIVKDEDGRLNLRDSVREYCRRQRERYRGNGADADKAELEKQHLALKNEKIREQLRSWRVQRDRDVGLAIIQALRSAMSRLRDECKLVPALASSIDALMDAADELDLDAISCEVEGEEQDDDED